MLEIIPKVLEIQRPAMQTIPVVFDSPHSGTLYPDDFLYFCDFQALQQMQDSFVDEFYESAPDHGAPLLKALFPRSYIDLNRGMNDLDPALLEEPWPEPFTPSVYARLGGGLIWRRTRPGPGGLPIYNRRLSLEEVQYRIEAYYKPYHRVLEDMIQETWNRFGVIYHVNCHSMPSKKVVTQISPEPHDLDMDFVLGDRNGTSCSPDFTHFVRDELQSMGYTVTVNDPYKGVELVQRYADPKQGRHSLQIEISRALYMDEESIRKTGRFDSLKTGIERLILKICDYAVNQVQKSAAE